MRKKCYYAHTMLSYGSTIEEQDVKTLEDLGFEVINPNQESIQGDIDDYIEKNGRENVMSFFEGIIDKCDLVAFRANPDGNILSGIAYELKHALKTNKPIIELPCSLEQRMWDYPRTKKYLIEIGHYKVEK